MRRALGAGFALLLAGCQSDRLAPTVMTDLPEADLRTYVTGQVITLDGDAGAIAYAYGQRGGLQYKDAKATKLGRWTVEGDQVCVAFSGENKSCRSYAIKSGTYYLVEPDKPRRVTGRVPLAA